MPREYPAAPSLDREHRDLVQLGPTGTALEHFYWLSLATQILPVSSLNRLLIDAIESAEAIKQSLS